MPTGLLLVNLGTPEAPTKAAVARYLREFLSDPRIIDINAVSRALLVNLIIVPTRAGKSAHAYQSIWDATRGSPLMYHSQDLSAAVAAKLGPAWRVALGMRYGQPSLANAIADLRQGGCDEIVVLPLFPQYASSSTGSAVAQCYALGRDVTNTPQFHIVPAFHDDAGFLNAFAAQLTPLIAAQPTAHVVFSFHGVPVRHITTADAECNGQASHCLGAATCCDSLTSVNRMCYRAQCMATARALAGRVGLTAAQYTVAFQSRLGRTPWIGPYTDRALQALAQAGTQQVIVCCPAFVADCLETIEEIGMRAAEEFTRHGGQTLTLCPSLNASAAWIDAVCALVQRHHQPSPDM